MTPIFFYFRNPNEGPEGDVSHGGRQERSRFKNVEWTAYEGVHKKYLNLGTSKFLTYYSNKSYPFLKVYHITFTPTKHYILLNKTQLILL